MEAILIGIMKLGPVVALLIFAIRYFYKKEKDAINDIKELNAEIRAIDRDNLEIISKLADAIDNMSDSSDNVHREIKELKDYIKEKIEKYAK